MTSIKIALLGLDTSHVKVFTKMISNRLQDQAEVMAGYPGGSPDFKASSNRVQEYTQLLAEEYGVEIADSPQAAAEKCDAVMITAVDGRAHPQLLEEVAQIGKPVFVDKPFALSAAAAQQMAETAAKHGIAMMSSSVRRYAVELQDALRDTSGGAICGAESHGVIEFTPTQPGWYWYGIHAVEALYAAMGRGCRSVQAVSENSSELLIGTWEDGRIGIARGNPHPNVSQGVVLHREKSSEYIDTSSDGQEKYFKLLEQVLDMFRTGKAAVPIEETIEIMRFIEAGNESRQSGLSVKL